MSKHHHHQTKSAHFSTKHLLALFVVYAFFIFVILTLVDLFALGLLGFLWITVITVVGAAIATFVHARQGQVTDVDEMADKL
ncbi:MAG: hypothetical protein KDI02_05070 [Anaerolineae bacterium]|nr:hypothetical protein [Anaerolineae bacterium]MCB0179945.1 hypothetical protein [Anaerolineae bacterium]MCB0223035.1 hypothetical protein [Anaerolineae bacterium]MCB9106333.1 hypothetical protein [Anaerolineales bacterium]